MRGVCVQHLKIFSHSIYSEVTNLEQMLSLKGGGEVVVGTTKTTTDQPSLQQSRKARLKMRLGFCVDQILLAARDDDVLFQVEL